MNPHLFGRDKSVRSAGNKTLRIQRKPMTGMPGFGPIFALSLSLSLSLS
jgi:hypothetical protein